MSGICAVLSRDGGPDGTGPVLNALARRGPDGLSLWRDRQATLGHAALQVLPEDCPQPLFDAPSLRAVTADARLDNRADLIAQLGLPRDVSEAAVILAAHARWGEDCAGHLEGDFAFALWDARAGRLLLARDQLGVKPLAWADTGDIFACASTPAALAVHPALWARVNLGRIADTLEPELEGLDHTETAFKRIRRLPPGHVLSVGGGSPRIWRYWSPEPGPTLRLRSDGEYAEAFTDVFDQAVRARLRSIAPVGVLLSGGVDSGAVAVTAARFCDGPLPVFPVLGDRPDCAETAAIRQTLTTPKLAPFPVTFDWIADQSPALLDLAVTIDDPFDAPMNLSRAACRMAARQGVRVMLDGGSGDLVFNEGSHLARLVGAGRLTAALAEARGLSRVYGVSPAVALARAAYRGLVPAPLRAARRGLMLRLQGNAPRRGSLLSAELARTVALGERRARLLAQDRPRAMTLAQERADALGHPYLAAGRERYDRVAAQQGIEPRDPYLDLRVVRFALSLPPEQLVSQGWLKPVLRRAMAGRLPDDVAWRTGKTHLGAETSLRLARSWPDLDAHLHGIGHVWGGWIEGGTSRSLDPVTALALVSISQFHERFRT